MTLQRLDASQRPTHAQQLFEFLKQRIYFQERALVEVANALAVKDAPFHVRNGPLAVLFFAGPSGVGKTETAHALAEFLFQDRNACTIINGSEYSQGHEIARLIGAPPGYIGYYEPDDDKSNAPPLLEQNMIDKPAFDFIKKSTRIVGEKMDQDEEELKRLKDELALLLRQEKPDMQRIEEIKRKIKEGEEYVNLITHLASQQEGICHHSVVVFDEIEKAHENLHRLLLQIISEGRLGMSYGAYTSFSDSFVIITSNIGSREIAKTITGESVVGYKTADTRSAHAIDQDIYNATMKELRRFFPPELVGRLQGRVVVFRPLSEDQLRAIAEGKLNAFIGNNVVNSPFPLELIIDDSAKELIFQKSLGHPEYGARPLEEKIRSHLIDPLNRLVTSGQVRPGARIVVKTDSDDVLFFLDTEVQPIDEELVRKIGEKIASH